MPATKLKPKSGLTGVLKAKATTKKADPQTQPLKIAMAFGTKNPPPAPGKRKRRILSSAERHMAEIEEMERDVGRKKKKKVKSKKKR